MSVITAAELAQAWGVSARYVQKLLALGRIPGAKRIQRRWVIPADAKKPARERDTPRYLTCGLLTTLYSMPLNDPDAALSALPDDPLRAQYAAELAYLRGDFGAVKAYYAALSRDTPTFLCAANIAIAAAMSTRAYSLFSEITSAVKDIAERSESGDTARAASMLPALTAVCMNAPEMAPDWLKAGDFTAFPMDARAFLVFLRVKYLQSTQVYPEMLATARTALDLCMLPDRLTLTDLYHTTLCACASYAMGNMDDTRISLEKSVALCAAGGFVTPLGEYSTWVGGLLQIALKKAPPAFEARVLSHIGDTLKNWLFFHNEFAKDNASLILTTREYQLALLLKEGKTYRQAARQLCLSPGRVKNLVSIIYEKLGIARKSEIGQYVY